MSKIMPGIQRLKRDIRHLTYSRLKIEILWYTYIKQLLLKKENDHG